MNSFLYMQYNYETIFSHFQFQLQNVNFLIKVILKLIVLFMVKESLSCEFTCISFH